MRDRTMTQDDHKEIVESLVLRFRQGEIGPVTLRMELRKHSFSESDINEIRNLHIDECAKNMRG